MITSKQINNLFETYKNGYKIGNDYIEVFTNPDSKELRDAATDGYNKNNSGSIRFLADHSDSKVYVWNARILHSAMAVKLGYADCVETNNYHVFLGLAKVDAGKAVVIESDNLNWRFTEKSKIFLDSFFNLNWNWLNTYINCSNYLAKRKEEYFRIRRTW